MLGIFKKKDNAALNSFRAMFQPNTVGILSAHCCDPSAETTKQQLIDNLQAAIGDQQIVIEVLSITDAQQAMLSAQRELTAAQKKSCDDIMGIFQSKGLMAFPLVTFNNEIVFSGGVPSVTLIQKHLNFAAGVSA